MRHLAEDNLGRFSVYSGNRYLIIRTKFEEYMDLLAEREEEKIENEK